MRGAVFGALSGSASHIRLVVAFLVLGNREGATSSEVELGIHSVCWSDSVMT